jgi:Fe-S oxidoreductase
MEEPVANRVSNLRAREAVATGADIVGVGCPFCMNMMEEAVNTESGSRPVKVRDIAELLHGDARA